MDFVDAEAVSIFLTPKIMLPPLFPSSPDFECKSRMIVGALPLIMLILVGKVNLKTLLYAPMHCEAL